MDKWGRQKYADQNYYSENQVKRSLIASGITIVSEVETDFIIFCPFHSNTRSPAGEVHKTNGMFYCFSCQETKELTEVIMVSTNRSYFEAARLIDSKSDNKNLIDNLTEVLEKKPNFVEYDLNVIEELHNNVFKNQIKKSIYRMENRVKKSWAYLVPFHFNLPIGRIKKSSFTVGRALTCDLILHDSFISHKHFTISKRSQGRAL